jgi:hypothetical protein
MKVTVFWDVVPCSLVEVYRRFRGSCRVHHQGELQYRGQTTIFEVYLRFRNVSCLHNEDVLTLGAMFHWLRLSLLQQYFPTKTSVPIVENICPNHELISHRCDSVPTIIPGHVGYPVLRKKKRDTQTDTHGFMMCSSLMLEREEGTKQVITLYCNQ